MSKVRRVFVEKKAEYDVYSSGLLADLRDNLGIAKLTGVRTLNRYDVQGLCDDDYGAARDTIFAEPPVDVVYDETMPICAGERAFAVEYLPGQYDQRADSAAQCIQLMTHGAAPTVASARVVVLKGDISDNDFAKIKAYCINPVDSREASLEKPESLDMKTDPPADVAVMDGFISMDKDGVEKLRKELGLAMKIEDALFCQEYFRDTEKRDPTITEIRMLDTYWSDHCRHTTFLTSIKNVEFEDGELNDPVKEAYEAYLRGRELVYGNAECGTCLSRRKPMRNAELKSNSKSFYEDKGAPPPRNAPPCGHTGGSNVNVKNSDTSGADAPGQQCPPRPPRPISLMDIALMGMKQLRKEGMLDDLDVSDEINACSIVVPAVVDGKIEDWLVMFKNETHNHPTEIEPFGGAATCLGGAIRDPLSGRSYVYQAMRVTGAGDPRAAVKDTLPGKLPQRKITTQAAHGYSSYGNQIGLATGIVSEIYHDGYTAKRMEIGAVVGAAPKSNVVREEPKPGDIVVLLGGRTGRDGCGGATGSSKEHTEESIQTCSAEVQKGNPPTERKIQRLFRDAEVSTMIRRCNDFGAGGVSVAIGELAAGLDIDLDAVPKKYEGLDGTELAISESQERMAVVIDKKDLKKFVDKAEAENLETAVVAVVTDDRRLRMKWRGKIIVDLSRDFIDTNGVTQETEVFVAAPKGEATKSNSNSKSLKSNSLYGDGGSAPVTPPCGHTVGSNVKVKNDNDPYYVEMISDLNVCSQRGLIEMFDSSIGAGTVLMPFGGKYQSTPSEAMVAKLPVMGGDTTTGTAMSYGFDPYLSSWSPFHGAVHAVLHSVAKIVAVGGDYKRVRLTLQEYFEKLGGDKAKWGKPFAALLGAYYAQTKLGIPAIGGKDSMSGTFKDINVPPTLVSFALAPVDVTKVISPEFKKVGSTVAYVWIPRDEKTGVMPDFEVIGKCYDAIYRGIAEGRIVSAHTIGSGGIYEAVAKMCFGNRIGFKFAFNIDSEFNCYAGYGDMIVELADSADIKSFGIDEYFMSLGITIDDKKIVMGDDCIGIDDLYRAWSEPLENVFPSDVHGRGVACNALDVNTNTNTNTNTDTIIDIPADAPINTSMTPAPKSAKIKVAKPRVLIPVFPGTNCEYDSARRFKMAGAEPEFFVLKNLKSNDIDESVKVMSEKISNAQLIMIPGGFSAGDEPDGSGKFIAAFFRNPRIKDAVTEFLSQRDGLMLGICNGFQALIKLGLVPYGEIRDFNAECGTCLSRRKPPCLLSRKAMRNAELKSKAKNSESCPTLTFNTIGRHISRIAYTKVNSVNSPWLSNVKIGDVHAIPISHGEGRFVASPEELRTLFANGQIATRYVNADGEFENSMNGNCNGSYAAVEGILSPDGRVFGKMGHSERIGTNVAKNIYGNKDQKIFEAGVAYFG